MYVAHFEPIAFDPKTYLVRVYAPGRSFAKRSPYCWFTVAQEVTPKTLHFMGAVRHPRDARWRTAAVTVLCRWLGLELADPPMIPTMRAIEHAARKLGYERAEWERTGRRERT